LLPCGGKEKKMKKNDSGNYWITMHCPCGGKHCSGELIIQPDRFSNRDGPDFADIRMFYIGVVDSSGNDESITWINTEQLQSLIKDLKILLETYGEE
jgi:hypothetical protein